MNSFNWLCVLLLTRKQNSLSPQAHLPSRPHEGGVPGERLSRAGEGEGGQVQAGVGAEEEDQETRRGKQKKGCGSGGSQCSRRRRQDSPPGSLISSKERHVTLKGIIACAHFAVNHQNSLNPLNYYYLPVFFIGRVALLLFTTYTSNTHDMKNGYKRNSSRKREIWICKCCEQSRSSTYRDCNILYEIYR